VLESRRLLEQVADARAREEANHLKDNFLASISHDLRNPLTAASATSQVLLRRLDRTGAVEPERLRAGLESIGSSALQMSRLLDELLDHARLRLDRPLELKQVRTDLVELARRVARAHDSASDRHNIELRVMEDSLVGFWDDERLERVLQNLLSNAIKYSPAGGRVLVHVESENNNGRHWAVVVVQDEGVGIPETELDRVFTPFYRGSNVSQQIAGTGIGLATAREVVQQHGGSISVESVLGTGTTFRIRLPLEDLPSSPGDQSTAETPESENAAGDLERLAWDASPP
jgi:signal transduction histidine kinase